MSVPQALPMEKTSAAARTPMAPPGTAWLLAAAVLASAALAALGYYAGLHAGRYLAPGLGALPSILLPLAALVVPVIDIVRALRRRSQSRRHWQARRFTEARRAAAGARDQAWSAIGAVLFLAPVLALLIFVTVNTGAVAKTFLKWEVISESFADVAKAAKINVWIAIGAELASLALGLVLAVGRSLPGHSFRLVRVLCITYIDVFRGLPAIVVVYLICFGLPLTETPFIGDANSATYAIIALTLTYAAYQAEILRAGIESIHPSQISAGRSLGLSRYSIFRCVVLPQALKRMAPPLLSIFVALQKDTALVNIVGIIDTFAQAKIYAANLYNLSAITVVCILFVLITIPQTRFVDRLIAKGKVAP
ncbi:MAG: amino acid ABC transporter permease [Ottowia sp.]|uniref:amino acid ABC transporter permease n=1 Tax=Ottowia sp. TaxID=1898956 RepID=UPI0039E6E3A8